MNRADPALTGHKTSPAPIAPREFAGFAFCGRPIVEPQRTRESAQETARADEDGSGNAHARFLRHAPHSVKQRRPSTIRKQRSIGGSSHG